MEFYVERGTCRVLDETPDRSCIRMVVVAGDLTEVVEYRERDPRTGELLPGRYFRITEHIHVPSWLLNWREELEAGLRYARAVQ